MYFPQGSETKPLLSYMYGEHLAHHFEPRALPNLQGWYLNTGFSSMVPPLETLVESPVKECSIGSGFSSVFSILVLRVLGGGRGGWDSSPPNKAPVSGKAGHDWRSPSIQSATFSTDSPTAIHPKGAALTP